jgi:hypothetical protein
MRSDQEKVWDQEFYLVRVMVSGKTPGPNHVVQTREGCDNRVQHTLLWASNQTVWTQLMFGSSQTLSCYYSKGLCWNS